MQQSNFDKHSSDWWEKDGSMRMLHAMNKTRILFIKERILNRFQNGGNLKKIFNKKTILDLGCGGGILSEALAREGAKIKAIDQSIRLIETAKKRLIKSKLNINYECTDIKKIYKKGIKFDVILCLEVIEHVKNFEEFIDYSFKCLNKNGLIVFSTINRNKISYLTTILIAEKILNLVPKNTHSWAKYIKPKEITELAQKADLTLDKLQGLFPFPTLSGFNWIRIKSPKVNYIISFKN